MSNWVLQWGRRGRCWLLTELRIVINPSILCLFTQCTFFVSITSNETKAISLRYAHSSSYQVEMELALQSAVWHQHVREGSETAACVLTWLHGAWCRGHNGRVMPVHFQVSSDLIFVIPSRNNKVRRYQRQYTTNTLVVNFGNVFRVVRFPNMQNGWTAGLLPGASKWWWMQWHKLTPVGEWRSDAGTFGFEVD